MKFRWLTLVTSCPAFVCALVAGNSGRIIVDGGVDEYAKAIVATSDRGFIVAGYTNSAGNGGFDILLLKFDSLGNLEWNKLIGGSGDDYCEDIIRTSDGGYAICGRTTSFGNGGSDMLVAKLNDMGFPVWIRAIGGAQYETCNSIMEDLDGSLVAAGKTYTFKLGSTSPDMYVVKLDQWGNVMWARSVGGYKDEEAYYVIRANDGGYVVAGYTGSFGQGLDDMYVIKLRNDGTVEWTRTIGGTGLDQAKAILPNPFGPSGGYVVVGETYSFDQYTGYVYVARISSWGYLYGTQVIGFLYGNTVNSAIRTGDGGCLILGASMRTFNYAMYLVKLDITTTLEWVSGIKFGNGDPPIIASDAIELSDGSFIVVGWTGDKLFDPDIDIYIAKVRGNGGFGGTPCPEYSDRLGEYKGQVGSSSSGYYTSTGVFVKAVPTNIVSYGSFSLRACGAMCNLNTLVRRIGDTLVAELLSAEYQWLDCDAGFSPIPGATGRKFIPDRPGSYAVRLSKNGCVDTSACYNVGYTWAADGSHDGEELSVFRRGNNTWVLLVKTNYTERILVRIVDLLGKEVISAHVYSGQPLYLNNLPGRGTYIVEAFIRGRKIVRELIFH